MRFIIGNRKVEVELQTTLIALMVLGWSLYYYFSTASKRYGEESVLFIKPLTVSLVICFFFVMWGAIKIDREKEAEGRSEEPKPKDIGFLDHRRVFFVSSIAVYAASMTFFGYMIPSAVFIFIVCYFLGVRNPWVLIIIPLALPALVSIIFVGFMKVPISVWPSW